ncbi:SIS domain-containing protein [Verrucomicrobiota bacterium]
MTDRERSTDDVYQASANAEEFAGNYIAHLSEVLAGIDAREVAAVIDALLAARETGSTVFFVGNGGSAATASHFANDLAIGTKPCGAPFRVMSLADNNAVMTAIANDYGYEQVFVKQLEALYRDGDLLVAISASGNSANVLEAVEYVKGRGGKTIGLTGFDGGQLRRMVDHAIHVQTATGEFGPVEDAHMVMDHLIGSYLGRRCGGEGDG